MLLLLSLLLARCTADVTWRNLSVQRPDRQFLLRPTSGVARAGSVTAVLGASGAGKSTFLRALIGAQPRGRATTTGKVDAAGAKLKGLRYGDAALLAQDGALFAMLTVRETLEFALALAGVDKATRRQRADAELRRLGFVSVADRRVGLDNGGSGAAISGGERRRLCVAVELARSPQPRVLCADEPTTGLDGVSAERVVRALKEQALAGNTAVVASLHQPSSKIWLRHIDDVILLAPGGRVAYTGATADAAMFVRRVTGEVLPPHTNPAEWLLEIVHDRRLATQLSEAALAVSVPPNTEAPLSSNPPRRAPRIQRVTLLFGRARRQVLRDGRVHALRLFATAGLGAVLGHRYRGDDATLTVNGCADRVAMLSFAAISTAVLGVTRSLDLFAKERPVVARETERGSYGGAEYVVAKALAELPLDAVFAALMGWSMSLATLGGLQSRPAGPLALVAVAASTLGLAIGAATPDADTALALGVPLTVIHMLTGIINPAGEKARRKPVASLSPIKWGVSWLIDREFRGATLGRGTGPRLGGLASVVTGDQVLERLGLAATRPHAAALVSLGAIHLLVAAVCSAVRSGGASSSLLAPLRRFFAYFSSLRKRFFSFFRGRGGRGGPAGDDDSAPQ